MAEVKFYDWLKLHLTDTDYVAEGTPPQQGKMSQTILAFSGCPRIGGHDKFHLQFN